MKMSELIARLDSPIDNMFSSDALIHELTSESDWIDLSEHGFTSRPITEWMCTDTTVGMNLIYFKGEPICVSEQTSRKADVTFRWMTLEAYKAARELVLDLVATRRKTLPDLIDMDEEFGEPSYTLNFSGQILAREVLYGGKMVPVVSVYRDTKNRHHVMVRVDGKNVKVPLKDILIPIPLKEAI